MIVRINYDGRCISCKKFTSLRTGGTLYRKYEKGRAVSGDLLFCQKCNSKAHIDNDKWVRINYEETTKND